MTGNAGAVARYEDKQRGHEKTVEEQEQGGCLSYTGGVWRCGITPLDRA